MGIKEEHPEWFPKCDYRDAVTAYRDDDYIQCRPGYCPHYGRCLPVYGIRETPEHAVGEQTRERGKYYHNMIAEGVMRFE